MRCVFYLKYIRCSAGNARIKINDNITTIKNSVINCCGGTFMKKRGIVLHATGLETKVIRGTRCNVLYVWYVLHALYVLYVCMYVLHVIYLLYAFNLLYVFVIVRSKTHD